MYKITILFSIVFASLAISGCAETAIYSAVKSTTANDMTYKPIIDEATTGQEKMAVYAQNKRECFDLADKRFWSENNSATLMLRTLGGNTQWKTNFQDTVRRCLTGRGYAVVN